MWDDWWINRYCVLGSKSRFNSIAGCQRYPCPHQLTVNIESKLSIASQLLRIGDKIVAGSYHLSSSLSFNLLVLLRWLYYCWLLYLL